MGLIKRIEKAESSVKNPNIIDHTGNVLGVDSAVIPGKDGGTVEISHNANPDTGTRRVAITDKKGKITTTTTS